jgi:hypothetical protein
MDIILRMPLISLTCISASAEILQLERLEDEFYSYYLAYNSSCKCHKEPLVGCELPGLAPKAACGVPPFYRIAPRRCPSGSAVDVQSFFVMFWFFFFPHSPPPGDRTPTPELSLSFCPSAPGAPLPPHRTSVATSGPEGRRALAVAYTQLTSNIAGFLTRSNGQEA